MGNHINVGYKSGCLTVIAGPEEYQSTEAVNEIASLELERKQLSDREWLYEKDEKGMYCMIGGEKAYLQTNEDIDRRIADIRKRERYKCQCKCGKIHYLEKETLLAVKRKYCDSLPGLPDGFKCGIRLEQEKKVLEEADHVKEPHYNDFPIKIHESLEVINFGEDDEVLKKISHIKGKKITYVEIRRTYRCKCQLCGQEWLFHYDDFEIRRDSKGRRFFDGYYSVAHCDCHKLSSFQWRTVDILEKAGVDYRAEVTFPGLVGVDGSHALRFDFAVMDGDKIRCLLECNGKQHYKSVDKLGGKAAFEQQKANDEAKRLYCKENGIPLFEIPYTCNTRKLEEKFLKKIGVIT